MTSPAATSGWGDHVPAVACVGLSCRDHVWRVERFPPVASRTPAPGYRAEGGGPAATAAVAVARLGGRARLWAIHGDDDAGRANAAELARFGVDLGGCTAPHGSHSFISAVLVGPDGERFIFPYRGHALADDPAAHEWAGLAGVGAVLIDGRHPRLAAHALAWAVDHGVPGVGDWSDLRHPELRARVDHLIASEEAGLLALAAREGAEDTGATAQRAAADPIRLAAAACAALRDHPEQLVAVTLGPEGCVWDDGRDVWHQAAPAVTVIDSTGAGDAFHGAYALALAAGRGVAAAIRLATAVGGLRCVGEGRAALPTLERADALAATLPSPIHHGRSPTHPGGPV
jgi:sulfofructose kinase